MKRLLGCFLCVMLLLFVAAASVQATPIEPLQTFDYEGMPSIDQLNDWIDEIDSNLPDISGPSHDGYALIDDVAEDQKTWNITWTGDWDYMTVKYDGKVDLFYIADWEIFDADGKYLLEWSGNWGLSNVRLWGGTSVPDAPIMLLLGPVLLGLGLLGRRRSERTR